HCCPWMFFETSAFGTVTSPLSVFQTRSSYPPSITATKRTFAPSGDHAGTGEGCGRSKAYSATISWVSISITWRRAEDAVRVKRRRRERSGEKETGRGGAVRRGI